VSSNCYSSGTDCPELKYNFKNEKGEPGSLTLSAFDTPMQDGTWTTWSSIITIAGKYFENNESAFITINGPEGGVDISLDNIKVYLPPAGHFPNPDAVCDELIVNGDNSQSQLFTYPLFSFDSAESLSIEQDANGNYMTMDVRGYDTSGPKVELVAGKSIFLLFKNIIPNLFYSGCLRNGAKYRFTSKVRMHDEEPIGSRVVLRYNDAKTGNYAFETLTECNESSKSLGWVDCNGEIQFSDEIHNPPFFLSWTSNDGSTVKTDWRDLSLKPISCSLIHTSGKCLRGATVFIDPEANPDIELVVTNIKNSNDKYTFLSTFEDNESESKNTHLGRATRYYWFVLPGGDWLGHFYLDGELIWPTYAEVVLDDLPSCEGSMVSYNLFSVEVSNNVLEFNYNKTTNYRQRRYM